MFKSFLYLSGSSPLCSIVRYDIHLLESKTYSSRASVGHSSIHFVQLPHKSLLYGRSYSNSKSIKISDKKNQEPILLLIKFVFLDIHPKQPYTTIKYSHSHGHHRQLWRQLFIHWYRIQKQNRQSNQWVKTKRYLILFWFFCFILT